MVNVSAEPQRRARSVLPAIISLRSLGTALALVISLVVAAGAPAQAASETLKGRWWGAGTQTAADDFDIELTTELLDNSATQSNQVRTVVEMYMGVNANTTATGCKVTYWTSLKTLSSGTWQTPKVTESCSWMIKSGSWSFFGPLSYYQTSGTVAQGAFCVDLYFNGSASSGWQKCAVGGWIYED
ncbi:hypothetical protein [Micromonospora sp. NPDC049274]|uniref:hypothetical protein n=1 Tax=Micromonospora sp. NPDC049274 TaxID=3154829 RepID=UPI00342104EE